MDNPLLTIAIPTWNRANILDLALSSVFPQMLDYKDYIEIIVSDNGSSDNTNAIIEKHIKQFPDLNIIHNKQPENTGYYGNFKKCRELSNGKYFWLLSDNDYISNGLIKCISNILITQKPSFIFLKDWEHSSKVKSKYRFTTNIYKVNRAIEKFNYKTTLISAVIFTNKKKNDVELFKKFKGNTFLGFALFLESLDIKDEAVEICGTSLYINDTKVSFNAFKSFAIDLIACIKHAVDNNIFPESIAKIFINKVIYELTIKHYILYRIIGKLHGTKHKKKDVDNLLQKGFSSYEAYHKHLEPLMKANKFSFYRLVIANHLFRLIKERLLR